MCVKYYFSGKNLVIKLDIEDPLVFLVGII